MVAELRVLAGAQHDRDPLFAAVATTIASMNIQEIRTAPRSPWQNAYVERVVGSIRGECLDHVVVANAAGLQRVLSDYLAYYLHSRTHLALDKDPPFSRAVAPSSLLRTFFSAFGDGARRLEACGPARISPDRLCGSHTYHNRTFQLALDLRQFDLQTLANCHRLVSRGLAFSMFFAFRFYASAFTAAITALM